MRVYLLAPLTLAILIAGVVTYVNTGEQPDPCRHPLTIKLGHVDPRFGIGEEELQDVLQDIVQLWSSSVNREMVKFDPDGKVSLNLVYSDQQYYMEDKKKLSDRIEAINQRLLVLEWEHQRKMRLYNNNRNRYEQLKAEYDDLIDNYRAMVARAKSDDMFTAAEKESLDTRQQSIEKFEARLQEQHRKVENRRIDANRVADSLKLLSKRQNSLAGNYNEQYGKDRTLNQGDYLRVGETRKINIYHFSNRNDLRLVLAHEVGHALGIGHVPNPKSIMFELLEKQDVANLQLTDEDVAALKRLCTP